MSTIFVQIASYRDPELMPTLQDCVSKASRPHELRFGICWQRDDSESLGEFAADRRFRVITVDYRESQGACWARHSLQAFYGGETYTLQLDSHHRFAPGWDNALIDLFRGIESEKPLLTTYLPWMSRPAQDERRRPGSLVSIGSHAKASCSPGLTTCRGRPSTGSRALLLRALRLHVRQVLRGGEA